MVQHWEEATKQAAQRPLLKSTENGTSECWEQAGRFTLYASPVPRRLGQGWKVHVVQQSCSQAPGNRAGRFTLYDSPVPRRLGIGLEGSR